MRACLSEHWRSRFRVVAINEIAPLETLAYLTQYDSIYGRCPLSVAHGLGKLQIDGERIAVSAYPELEKLSWGSHGVDLVLECSGRYRRRNLLARHLEQGAGKVLLSCPGAEDLDATIVFGVNDHLLTREHRIVSNASCTTNCIVPVIEVLDEAFGIEYGMMTTIHSLMNDQPLLDAYHCCGDLRRNRGGMHSMVPVATELARGVGRILPHLAGRFRSSSLRVPVNNVSAIDLSVFVRQSTDEKGVNMALARAAEGRLLGVLGYTEEQLVSCDFQGDSRSAIVDGGQTRVSGGGMIRVLAWFDNEWGYANRMLDTALRLLEAASL